VEVTSREEAVMNTPFSGTRRLDPRGSEPLLGPASLSTLLGAAVRAPSLHNSQPWAFAVEPARIELYADPTRHLKHADPSGRSLLVSCGAALFNLRVAAEHGGFHPRVRILPDSDRPTLVARLEVDHRHRGTDGLGGYYSAIQARRTNRRPFRNWRLPTSVVASLSEAVRVEGALLRVYDDPDEVERVIGLLHDADLAEHADPARVAERQAWIGGPHRSDGIPVAALGPLPTQARAAHRDLGHAVGGVRDHAEFEIAPMIGVISTSHDRPADWVRAGQALERLLLDATAAGVSASFINQPLEHDDLRFLVRSPLTGVGHSQMVLRLGYGDEVPATPRRAPVIINR
jgi:nitroreductase